MPARVPKYIQVSDDIRQKIQSGEYKPGDMLPTHADLMDDYGVSSTVIRDAVTRLKNLGLVEGQQGKALYVAPAPPPKVTDS